VIRQLFSQSTVPEAMPKKPLCTQTVEKNVRKLSVYTLSV
jgi:hypothetical protein